MHWDALATPGHRGSDLSGMRYGNVLSARFKPVYENRKLSRRNGFNRVYRAAFSDVFAEDEQIAQPRWTLKRRGQTSARYGNTRRAQAPTAIRQAQH